jgi:DNA-directed RNA polymerase
VNLVDGVKPRDVYSGVCAIVVEKIHAEAIRTLGPDATEQEKKEHASAVLVDGLIDRKVVKQTVMTSVYGVTFIGARRQIQNRLEEKLEGVSLCLRPVFFMRRLL